jgi:hypothetical protein
VKKTLGQPTDDLEASARALGVDAALALDAIRYAVDPGFHRQLQADLTDEQNLNTPNDPDRTQRLLAAYRDGTAAVREYVGLIAHRLLREGKVAELLELHATLPMPPGRQASRQAWAMHEVECAVLYVPGLPADVVEQAATRVQWVLDNYDFSGEHGLALKAAALHTLAVARLRQKRFPEVEPLCKPALVGPLSKDARATVLATVVLARRALGQSYEELLAEAVALGPDADLVAEAAGSSGAAAAR